MTPQHRIREYCVIWIPASIFYVVIVFFCFFFFSFVSFLKPTSNIKSLNRIPGRGAKNRLHFTVSHPPPSCQRPFSAIFAARQTRLPLICFPGSRTACDRSSSNPSTPTRGRPDLSPTRQPRSEAAAKLAQQFE